MVQEVVKLKEISPDSVDKAGMPRNKIHHKPVTGGE